MLRDGRQKSIQLQDESFSRRESVASILRNGPNLKQAWEIACEHCSLKGLQPTRQPFVFLCWKNAPLSLRTWALQLAYELAQVKGNRLKPLTPTEIKELKKRFKTVSAARDALLQGAQPTQSTPVTHEFLALLHGGLDEGDPLYSAAEQAYAGSYST